MLPPPGNPVIFQLIRAVNRRAFGVSKRICEIDYLAICIQQKRRTERSSVKHNLASLPCSPPELFLHPSRGFSGRFILCQDLQRNPSLRASINVRLRWTLSNTMLRWRNEIDQITLSFVQKGWYSEKISLMYFILHFFYWWKNMVHRFHELHLCAPGQN